MVTCCMTAALRFFRQVFFVLVGVFILSFGAGIVSLSPGFANEALSQANTSLINGRYKDVVTQVGKIIATGKQKPDVMARALLIRGIAYRNQGKLAQAIADFSNAEWLQKLRGVELRRLYTERALAYDAVGQKQLAAKDRGLASGGSSRLVTNKQDVNGKIVRSTPVSAAPSATSEFFGGLGKLFDFSSSEKKKTPPPQKVVVQQQAIDRQIPTLDSAEAKANRIKLQAEANEKTKLALQKKKTSQKIEGQKKTNVTPSNSAWDAKRAGQLKTPAGQQKIQKQQQLALNQTPRENPVTLTPKKVQDASPGNPVTSFFQNIFGGDSSKEETPVRPGDDVIAADQVASIERPAQKIAQERAVTRKSPAQKKVAETKRPVWMAPDEPQVKKPVKKAPARKKVAQREVAKRQVARNTARVQETRSLYHIQLGVFGEAQAADKFVNRLNSKYGALIRSKTAMVVETDMGQARPQYRVYVGPFRSRKKGEKSCKALKQLGMGCSLVE